MQGGACVLRACLHPPALARRGEKPLFGEAAKVSRFLPQKEDDAFFPLAHPDAQGFFRSGRTPKLCEFWTRKGPAFRVELGCDNMGCQSAPRACVLGANAGNPSRPAKIGKEAEREDRASLLRKKVSEGGGRRGEDDKDERIDQTGERRAERGAFTILEEERRHKRLAAAEVALSPLSCRVAIASQKGEGGRKNPLSLKESSLSPFLHLLLVLHHERHRRFVDRTPISPRRRKQGGQPASM